ncbi:MAG: formate dehydrogenase subunit alpha [Armatimonadota bacterium]|nr:formate dehydrogenase subunit alpha [Armatimonadota bacterium]MDR7450585.1 formate dehydrogenase subunit alpha [Armatimonadota bacterium]MDR7466282.1 formate dehydrogenase subunit alpha [Armatimonadota bacterium]MDR7493003.1 formate dehydrogenase subunit alpha [Armatimonadota bacterium]MDR7498240.1 formate dehydrogenase subunit alpha [Armatimonadota bacterium]
MVRVTVNGRTCEFRDGLTVLAALESIGVHVPQVCFDPRLAPYGGCRLCAVKIDGFPRPPTACTTPLADGMVIESHAPEVESLRRSLLRMLARRYPRDAVLRDPDKEFHRYLRAYGLTDELPGSVAPEVDESHPYLRVDMAQCISCYRCVRICEEVQGQFVWQVWERGDRSKIVPDSGGAFADSTCVSCGACVDTCPTGALEDRSVLAEGAPTTWTRTTCPYCGVGCELLAGTRNGRLVQVKPVLEAPVNKGHLCVKGRYAFTFVHAPDRITTPLIREGARWRETSWDEAISFAARRLREIAAQHGPPSVGVLGSARATNEENYLAQKFARVVLQTNNVDCCARVCHAPSAAALRAMLGTGAATSSFDDIERARTILLCGTNATENHPIVGARIKQAVLRGARLIVIDPRRIELADYADYHLQLRPGTNVPLLNAMAAAVLEEGLADEAFLALRADGVEAYREFIRTYAPERVADLCGVEARSIRDAARLYATEKPSLMFHGLGVTEHTQGTEGVMCLANLALLTGNVGRPGTGINPLRGQNNVQGAAHMGCEPDNLTGFVPVADGRALFEQVWGAPIPAAGGLNAMQMLDAARAGAFRALWVIGWDVLLTNPDAGTTEQAFAAMDLVIVQDLFLQETARRYGTVFFPCASSFEKDGTFMNSERRVQRIRQALPPVGQSRPDWQILCAVAAAMGKGEHFAFRSAEEIWNEIRRVWPAGAGISFARLEQGGLQWPCPSEDHPGTPLLHGRGFPIGARATLRRIAYRPTPEAPSAEFPFVLITGRNLYQFNAGTMTARTANSELRPSDVLDLHPEDARALGLRDGERAAVRSRYGAAVLPVRLTTAVGPGVVFATFHTAEIFLNRVTGPHRDPQTATPEYKVTAVQIAKA